MACPNCGACTGHDLLNQHPDFQLQPYSIAIPVTKVTTQ